MPETATELTPHQEGTLARVRSAAPEAVELYVFDADPLIAHGLIREVDRSGCGPCRAAYAAV